MDWFSLIIKETVLLGFRARAELPIGEHRQWL
jgi:hypothetical protein